MECSYGIGVTEVNSSTPTKSLEIQRLHVHSHQDMEVQYSSFFNDFLVKNEPCLITADEVVASWPAIKHWVTQEGRINIQFLLEKYGGVSVPVTQISEDMSMDYGGMTCDTMKVTEYLTYLKKYSESGYPNSMPCLYLKDWHIHRNSDSGQSLYKQLHFFTSDFLNEVCDLNSEDDFRFVYLGPKGSWTPLHADVYGSFSWSMNIVGRKRWRLYPPGRERAFNMENPGVEGQDFMDIVQHAKETLFVPSGWHHIVWNEEDTLSINHNWFNASNLCYVWHQLQSALALVKKEIEDLKHLEEFREQCQLILKANHGMDYNDFGKLIMDIWKIREEQGPNDKHKQENADGFNQNRVDCEAIVHLISEHLSTDGDLGKDWKQKLQQLIS